MKAQAYFTPFVLLVSINAGGELVSMSEEQLDTVSGYGVNLVLRDVSLDAGDTGNLNLDFSNYSSAFPYNRLSISGLKIYESAKPGEQQFQKKIDIGSADNPITLLDITEQTLPRGNRDIIHMGLPERLGSDTSSYIDKIDIQGRLAYSAINGFFEDGTNSINYFDLDIRGADLSGTSVDVTAEPGQGVGIATKVNATIDRICINQNSSCPQPDSAIPANSGIVAIDGIEIKNLEFGNKYQPMLIRTTTEPTRTIQMRLTNGAKPGDFGNGDGIGGPFIQAQIDDNASKLANLGNTKYQIAEVKYLPEGTPYTSYENLQTANIPRFETEVTALTPDAAVAKYTNPETGQPYTAAEYRGTLTDIKIKSLTFGNGVTLDPTSGASALAEDQQSYTLIDPTSGLTYDVGANVIEITGFEVQYMKFTPRDVLY